MPPASPPREAPHQPITTSRHSGARVLGRAAWMLWFLLSATSVVVVLARPGFSDEGSSGIAFAGYATTGALIVSRRPRNPVGWVLLGVAVFAGVSAAVETYLWTGLGPGRAFAGWGASWFWDLWLVLAGIFLPLLFPTGRPPAPRWRWVAWCGAAAFVFSVLGVGLRPGPLDLATGKPVDNPLGVTALSTDVFSAADRLGTLLFAVAVLGTVISLGLRLRASQGVERQQLKWFTFVGVVTLGGAAVAGFSELVALPSVVADTGWTAFISGAVVGLPVAVAIAVLRYRLYDVDRVINKTVVYATLTAGLLTTYFLCVLVLERVIDPIRGSSSLAVAGSTLAVAALFRPARRRLQTAVDRRFYRDGYDAARTLDDFATRLRHEVDLDTVREDLRRTADDAFHPAHVSVWIRP